MNMNNIYLPFTPRQNNPSPIYKPPDKSSNLGTYGFNDKSSFNQMPSALNEYSSESSSNFQYRPPFTNNSYGTTPNSNVATGSNNSTGNISFGLSSKSKPFFGTSHFEPNNQPTKFPSYPLAFTSQANNPPSMNSNGVQQFGNNEKLMEQSKPEGIKKDFIPANQKPYEPRNIIAKSSTVKPGTNILGGYFNTSIFYYFT